jgi:phosphate transport system permease protein
MTTEPATMTAELEEHHDFDPTAPLTATGNLRRRHLVNRIAEWAATGAAFLAVGVLGIVVFSVLKRGAPALSIDFLTKNPPPFGGPGGGIAPAIVGTALLVFGATLMAMPLGILIALYMTEFAGKRSANAIRLFLDLVNGLPSIVIGLFVFGLLVVGHHQSGFAGSVALAVIMLPLIARGTQEVLLLVPQSLREAADALGVSRFRAVIGVILPSALGGILTSTILAVARAAGETAPLIFASSIPYGNGISFDYFGHGLSNIPISIFQLSEQADPAGFERAWGAAFVLLSFILIVSLAGRASLARSRAKLKQ